MPSRTHTNVVPAAILAIAAPIALAQSCEPAWEAGFGGMIQPGGELLCAAMFDDGSGPALYIGGYHDGLEFALSPSGLARIRDGQLEVIPPIVQGLFNESVVRAMLVHDDGSGPALYLAGAFRFSYAEPEYRGVVRWRNGGWESAGIGLDSAQTLAEFDEDGDGPAPPRLFAGGSIGSGAIHSIARWDGQSWSSVGPDEDNGGSVLDMVVGDDGSGPALYVGGSFGTIGGIVSPRIARWNGAEWSSVGGGLPTLQLPTNVVFALAWHDDGSGPALYAGGQLSVMTADGPTYGMARWDGRQWGAVGVDQESVVRAAASQTIKGAEELLVIVGQLDSNGDLINSVVARRAGASFEPLPGQPQFRFPLNAALTPKSAALATHDEGILVLGRFDTVDDDVVARGVAVWDGQSFTPYLDHLGLADVSEAPALAVDPQSGALYLGGNFAAVGGHFRPYLARFDEQGWSAMGSTATSAPLCSMRRGADRASSRAATSPAAARRTLRRASPCSMGPNGAASPH